MSFTIPAVNAKKTTYNESRLFQGEEKERDKMMYFFCSFITRGKTLDSVPRHGQGQIQLIAASTTQRVWLMQH